VQPFSAMTEDEIDKLLYMTAKRFLHSMAILARA